MCRITRPQPRPPNARPQYRATRRCYCASLAATPCSISARSQNLECVGKSSSSFALPAKTLIQRKLSGVRKGGLSWHPRQLNKSRVVTKRCLFRIEDLMRIHVGCELGFDFPQTTPMIVMLNVHFSRVSGLERPDCLITHPSVTLEGELVRPS